MSSNQTDTSSKPKQPELAKHDASVLDLAFVMDCTGSMGSYIQNATESIRQIVEDIVAMEKSDIKLALVEYRDHPPQDATFVTRSHDFTESVKEMKKWLEGCSAQGGGDGPEAVADGLHDALKLSWRDNATKICVLISDAPPHGLGGAGDGFPNGCPNGIDPLDVVRKMAEKGITLYAVGCEPALLSYKDFFAGLAYTTGGQYVPLRNAKLLSKVIVGGAVEEISLEKLMAEVETEVEAQRAAGITDERVLTDMVQSKLKSKGVKTNQIMLNNQNLEKASESAVKYSKMSNLSDLRKEFKPTEASYDSPAYGSSFMAAPTSMMSRVRNVFSSKPTAAPGLLHMDLESEGSVPPAPMAFPSSAAVDSYAVMNDDIKYEQTERMVQKALNRKKK